MTFETYLAYFAYRPILTEIYGGQKNNLYR